MQHVASISSREESFPSSVASLTSRSVRREGLEPEAPHLHSAQLRYPHTANTSDNMRNGFLKWKTFCSCSFASPHLRPRPSNGGGGLGGGDVHRRVLLKSSETGACSAVIIRIKPD